MAGEWEKVRLGDLVKITHGWPFKSECFTEERTGRPIIVSIGNFKYTGGFRFESTTIKEYAADYPKEYELTPGDILLVMTCQTSGGEILGIPGRIPDDGNIYLHNQRMGKVVIKDRKRIAPGFVYYLALWSDFNRELCVSASGTKILHTAPVRIEAFEFNLPPLAEQKAIAAVLGALDDKIELNRRMNATLEAMARALFQSWFVDFDPVRAKLDGRVVSSPLPVGEGQGEGFCLDPATAALFPASFQDSEAGHIPKSWEVVSLDALASIRGGKQLPTEDCLPVGKFTVFGANGIMGYATESTHEGFVIAFGRVGAYCGSIHWSLDSAWINNNASAVVPLQWPAFVLQTMLNIDFNSMRTGSAQPFIPNSSLASAKVLRPSPQIAEAFCRIVEPLRRQQADNDKQSRTLATLRDTLLPKLLSRELSTHESAS